MALFSKYCFIGLSLLGSSVLFGADASSGSTASTLDAAIGLLAGSGTLTFTSGGTLTLSNQVRALNASNGFAYLGGTITVEGATETLNGLSGLRGFFIGGSSSSPAGITTIRNLKFLNCKAKGGDGAGGGMGAGGALYLGTNIRAIVENCSFTNCQAQGGSGGTSTTQGGGGLTGNATGFGGGGFGGNGINPGGGASNFTPATAVSPGANFDNVTVAPAGDPGIGALAPGSIGGFGGGGTRGALSLGGPGGRYAGGGSDGTATPGTAAGGFGGGGGSFGAISGGAGGFGGGGGFAAAVAGTSTGGFGGGNGNNTRGGRGASFGGAIFMEPGSELTMKGTLTLSGNSAIAPALGNATAVPLAINPTTGVPGVFGQDIFMMSTSTLIFDLSQDFTMPSAIEGNRGIQTPAAPASTTTGGLIKRGQNTLTLTGNNLYTGLTDIQEGTVVVNGSVITDIEVQQGATLSGNLEIRAGFGGGDLRNRGTVSPGGTGIGLIQIEGDFQQFNTGTLRVDITFDGQKDLLFLTTGNAFLDGTLQVIINPGTYIAGTTYKVIDGPTNGTQFSNIIKTGTFANLVDIQVSYSSVILTILTNQILTNHTIAKGIPTAVVDCLRNPDDPIQPFSDLANVVSFLGLLSDKQVNQGLISFSPVLFGSLEWINERNNSYVANLISQHLNELCCSPRECGDCGCGPCRCECNGDAWVTIFGNFMDNNKYLDNLAPFTANAGGGLAGVDFCCADDCGNQFYYGLSGGFTYTHLIWRNDGGNGKLFSYYGSLYGSWLYCDCFAVDISAIGGATDNHLRRYIEFPGIDQRIAKSDPWNYFATAHLGVRGYWDWCCTNFEPFALADYHYYHLERFREKGAQSLNLVVKRKDQHMMRGEAGLRTSWEYDNNCSCYSPYLALSWVGEFPLHKSKERARLKGRDCVIKVKCYDSSVQLVSPEAGVKLTCCNGISVGVGYKGLYNKKTNINQVNARLDWVF